MKSEFYVYFHINPVKNEIFYVGKGTRYRAFEKTKRNLYWERTVKKYGYVVDIVEEGLTNEQAKEREKFYIKKIGKHNLTNITDGGEGCTGFRFTTTQKKKLSELKKGDKNPNYGKKISEEHKEILLKSRLGKKHSEETKQKMSDIKKGKSVNNGEKNGMYDIGEKHPMYGKKHSEETKQKMREAKLKKNTIL